MFGALLSCVALISTACSAENFSSVPQVKGGQSTASTTRAPRFSYHPSVCADGTYPPCLDGSVPGSGGGGGGTPSRADTGGDSAGAGTTGTPTIDCAADPTQPQCDLIARRDPHAGDDCWQSPGPKLGDNMPVNSSDSKTEVVDIAALTFKQSGGGTTAYGWIYTERGGDVYVAENAQYRSSFEGFVSAIPALSGVAAALQNAHGGLVPISSSQGQTIMSNWNSQPAHTAGSCFKKPLLA